MMNTTDNGEAKKEMPEFQSHKKVWALKIKEITFNPSDSEEVDPTEGVTLIFEEEGYAPLIVDAAYRNKHEPQVGGYYVVYADGYRSWSPADVFEEGYSPILEDKATPPEVVEEKLTGDDAPPSQSRVKT